MPGQDQTQGGQQNGQSSSQSGSQSQSQGSAAQKDASQTNTQSQGGQNQQNNGGQQQQQQVAQRPEWVPETFFDATKGEIKGADLRKQFDDLTAFKAADDTRRLTLPQKPEDLKVEFSKDFKLPDGIEFNLDTASPLWDQAKQLMLDMQSGKISGQAAFSKQADLLAGYIAGSEQKIQAARNAEIAKIGPNGPALVGTITTWMDAMGAPALKAMLVNADIVNQFAGLMTKFSSQGAASFTQNGRDMQTGGVSDEAYDKMSPREQLEYSQKHKQQAA